MGGVWARAHNSAVECVLHTDEVGGPNPSAPTEILEDFCRRDGQARQSCSRSPVGLPLARLVDERGGLRCKRACKRRNRGCIACRRTCPSDNRGCIACRCTCPSDNRGCIACRCTCPSDNRACIARGRTVSGHPRHRLDVSRVDEATRWVRGLTVAPGGRRRAASVLRGGSGARTADQCDAAPSA
jgi:hypothetical protein